MKIGSTRALVLNQDFSPITVCSIPKAFLLLFLQKAELIEKDETRKLRSVDRSFPFPSVIRLTNYVNMPYKGVMLTRQNVFKRDGHQCQYCGTSKVAACKRCNARKGNNTPEESNMKLKRLPFKPNYVMFIRDFSGQIDEKWLPFLKTKQMSA